HNPARTPDSGTYHSSIPILESRSKMFIFRHGKCKRSHTYPVLPIEYILDVHMIVVVPDIIEFVMKARRRHINSKLCGKAIQH
ncbi:hypothetical protein AX14_001557, partial [Amanita brunnescens Koide BX004]